MNMPDSAAVITGTVYESPLERHLAYQPGDRKRILTLDGGGVRGMITLGLLERLEEVLAPLAPEPVRFRLSHYFDLIAGTSTGAIIASGLAMGMSVNEVKNHYFRMAPDVFRTPKGLGILRARFDATALERHLKSVFGTMTLGSDRLETGLMICCKRIDTGSPWILTNNPQSKYWVSEDDSFKANRDYELRTVIRASTAAPYYFDPALIVVNEGGKFPRQVGLFVDGAMGGHNTPTVQAILTATLPAYGFCWALERDKMLMISLGTGWWRMRHDPAAFMRKSNLMKARDVAASMVQDSSLSALMVMQALSEPRKPWTINSELGDQAGESLTMGESLVFQRFDASLEADDVTRALNLGLLDGMRLPLILERLRQLDNGSAKNLRDLYAIGLEAGRTKTPGKDGIETDDFPAAFDPEGWKRPVAPRSA
ncbi:MAG: patatin-like phospholipase family protein [Hyphomicrobiaceae bacterium]